MTQPTTDDLLQAPKGSIDPNSLRFDGLRGDSARHLSHGELAEKLAALPPAPRDDGRVDLLVARDESFQRHLPQEVLLTPEGGMPGDRWAGQDKYGPDYQLATTRSDFARLIANGQPMELHGDNLYLYLDLSPANLPPGSTLRLGEALVTVTPQAHNGCKKWVQRFGLDVMQMNLSHEYRDQRLRGIYLRVLEAGRVRVGDRVRVVRRPD